MLWQFGFEVFRSRRLVSVKLVTIAVVRPVSQSIWPSCCELSLERVFTRVSTNIRNFAGHSHSAGSTKPHCNHAALSVEQLACNLEALKKALPETRIATDPSVGLASNLLRSIGLQGGKTSVPRHRVSPPSYWDKRLVARLAERIAVLEDIRGMEARSSRCVAPVSGIASSVAATENPQAPEERSQAPEEHSQAPDEHHQAPEEPPQAPDEHPQAPQEHSQAPEEPPQAPEEPPQAPEERPQAPEDPPQAPYEHSQAPDEHPQAPEEPPQAPDEHPQAPEEHSQAPEEPPQAPEEHPQAPEEHPADSGFKDQLSPVADASHSDLLPDSIVMLILLRSIVIFLRRYGAAHPGHQSISERILSSWGDQKTDEATDRVKAGKKNDRRKAQQSHRAPLTSLNGTQGRSKSRTADRAKHMSRQQRR